MTSSATHSPRALGFPLRVCYVINYLGFGGAERQLVELANGLDKKRFQAIVVTLSPGGPLEPELKEQPGIILHTLNRKSKFDLAAIVALARLLRQHRVHVVQPWLTPACFIGLSAALLARTPMRIVTERCGLRRTRNLGNRVTRGMEDYLSRFADAAVPNSEAGRAYLTGRGISPQKVHLIYNGINPRRLRTDPAQVTRVREQLGVPAGGWVIGNLASLTPPKDQATLLRAVAGLLPALPDVRVALVGDGSLRSELARLAEQLGLGSKVVFFGYQHRVADFIAAMDVAVLSSRDNEGCSNFLLEAMALGKPVVATDVGGNRELVTHGQNGLLVPIGEPQAMSQAILSLLYDAERRRAMGAQGQQLVSQRFSLGAMVAAYQDLYCEVAQGKRDFNPAPKALAA